MLRVFLKYVTFFIISVTFAYQFHDSLTQLKLIPKGLVKLIFPEKKIKPIVEKKNIVEKSEILNTNSFELKITKIDYFSGYNKNKEGEMNPQHKSAALYGINKDNTTQLELYTRDGFLITKEGVKTFDLPKNI